MTVTPPVQNPLAPQQVRLLNPVPVQSATLAVTATTGHITFTNIPSTNRLTFLFANTGSKTCYISPSNSASIIAAVAGSSTPKPSSGSGVQSTCHAIGAGLQIALDFIGNIDTISAICGGTDTTTLEMSLCM